MSRFVPYLDAACVARLLDEWVGPDGWHDSYEQVEVAGTTVTMCHLAVRGADGEWIVKTDVGTTPTFQAQKGAVSDSFKRTACLKWGAGRNVYELPTLWAPCRTYTSNGKTHAAACPETLPSILAQLRDLGFDAAGGRVGDTEPAHAEPTGESPTSSPGQPGAAGGSESPAGKPPAPAGGSPELRNTVTDLFGQIDEAHHAVILAKLKERGLIKRRQKGSATMADPEHLPRIVSTLQSALEFYAAGGDLATGESPTSSPGQPGAAAGSESPDSVERLMTAIEQYEGQLDSDRSIRWCQWFEEHHGDQAGLTDLDEAQLQAAFAAISEIAAS